MYGRLLEKLRLRRRNGERENNHDLNYDRPVSHRDLAQLQTVKKFVEQGYSPRRYESEEGLLHLENEHGDTLTMAEVPVRVATFLTSIQERL